MENINPRRNFARENPEQNPRFNLNTNSPIRKEVKSYNSNPFKKSDNLNNLNFNTYNISSQSPNNGLINLEKYNNIGQINQSKKNALNFNSKFPLHCPACQCQNTYYHVHHFHIPHNYTHICPRLNKLQNEQSNQDLLNEIAELKEECRKFKDELEKTKSENEIGNKYIKLLENKINLKQYNNKDDEDNIENRYHSMLDKSFEVLNSVSNKCDDEKGKLKGNTSYYVQKEPDYNSLIEAQKRWLDNLPEKYNNFTGSNYNNNNLYNNSTFSNTNDKFGDIDNDNSHYNEKYFNNMRNFNKTVENNKNNNRIDNPDIFINKNNPNTFPNFNINNNYEDFNRFNNNLMESKEPDLEEQIPQDENENEKAQEEEMIQQNDNINSNEENLAEENPFNQRFLVIDKDGNPIIIGGQKLYGMKLNPLIGEDGKEELDENGNIIFIGPDGQPKSQEELEPILLDNDKPLVNEENRPFLGINGIPLINEYGSPILGPGELYDRNNNIVKGVLGNFQLDNFGNDQKMMNNQDNNEENINNIGENNINDNNINENNINDNNINDNNINDNNINDDKINDDKINDNYINGNNINDNNNINNNMLNGDEEKNESNNINNEKNENNIKETDYNKLRPLIGANGLPVRDSENNFVFLDENNKPVKNTGFYLLLDQNGRPVLNSKGKPILINSEGKPINLVDNDKNNNFINNQLIKKMINPKENDINPKNETNNKGYIKYSKPKLKKSDRKKKKNEDNNRYNMMLMNDSQNLRDKRNKGQFTYSEVSSDEIKKIQFMNNSQEYKGNCFACDVGCSVSRSGYSPMNFVPYNNMIRRREVTPIKGEKKKKKKGANNIRVNKLDGNDDNNYYLTEG